MGTEYEKCYLPISAGGKRKLLAHQAKQLAQVCRSMGIFL